jgi:hypothetical protein
MVLHQMKSKLVGIVALGGLSTLGLQGCGGDGSLPSADEATTSAPASTADLEVVAETTMHVVNGHLTIDPVTTPSDSAPGLKPDGFGPLSTGKGLIMFATGLDGPGTGSCTAAQYCAQITTTNLTGRIMDNTFVEITDYFSITPSGSTVSWAGAPVTASAAYKSAFKNSSNVQAATIGTLAANAANTQEFKFNAGGSTSFSYHVSVLGSFRRTSISGSFQQKQAAVDACTMAGHDPPILVNQDDAEVNVPLPFAYTFYDVTYDRAVIGSNGYFLPYKTGGTPPTIAGFGVNNGTAPTVGTYVFWDDLEFDSGNGVCTATTGTTPNRTWTVTWKNARINPIQPAKPANTAAWGPQQITYSFQIRELIDQGTLIFNVPTGGITNLTRGSSATAGEYGIRNGAPYGQLFIFNAPSAYLPVDPTAYTTKLVRAAYVANP